jgi:hypothetical protein
MENKLTNNQKTELVKELGMSRDYNLCEQFLMDMGMGWVVSLAERIRVFSIASKNPRMKVRTASDNPLETDFPLMSDGIDYE